MILCPNNICLSKELGLLLRIEIRLTKVGSDQLCASFFPLNSHINS